MIPLQKNKIFHLVWRLEPVALAGLLLVGYLIISTLNRGISCDEGYYLLGYLKHQPNGNLIIDFQYIIKGLFGFLPDDSVIQLSAIRLLLTFLSLFLFTITSFNWLQNRFALKHNYGFYSIMIFLAGGIGFTFGTPVLYYDNMQAILYLTVFAFLFHLLNHPRKRNYIALLLMGFLLVFALTNYLPSGILLGMSILLFIGIEQGVKTLPRKLIYLIVGFIAGAMFYHVFIHNLFHYIHGAIDSFKLAQSGISNHDNHSLLTAMVTAIGITFITYIPILFILYWMHKHVKINKVMQLSFWMIFIVILLLMRTIYKLESLLYLFPIVILFSVLISQKTIQLKDYFNSKPFWLLILLIGLPFMGIFGTDQSIFAKAILFMPFWMVAYWMVFAQFNRDSLKIFQPLSLSFIVLLVCGYIYLGNFSRYQYNYTPRSSKVFLEHNVRFKSILVSSYQQAYYRDVCDTLNVHGFHPGDQIVAFADNLMAVYIAGGYFPGGLVYDWSQYSHIPSQPASFFILFKGEENAVKQVFAHSGWNFPANYTRIEMRSMSQNMAADKYATIIYYLTKNKKL
jgi:hypothetical protein